MPQDAFLERRAPIAIVFGSFACVFVPLLLLVQIPNFFPYLPHLLLLESIGLGTTHFFITLTVYLSAQNRAYFASSVRNKLIFFAAPAAILAFYAVTAVSTWREQHPYFAAYLFAGLRFFDFFHVGRQSFGMLQLWKRAGGTVLPRWLRRSENVFFVGLAALQWETFAYGGNFDRQRVYAVLPAVALAALFCLIIFGYAHARIRGQKPLARPSTYFVLQAICGASTVYQTRLYLIALALHYSEYHVMMYPRCFRAQLDPSSRIDRAAGALRQTPALFYGLLIAIVVLFELRNLVPLDAPVSTRLFVHIFDGIFLLHYVLEAFLWKFHEPHYRATLAPLYFAALPVRVRSRARRSFRALAAAGACASLVLFSWSMASSTRVARAFATLNQYMVDPLLADQHLRWGIRLADRGELEPARLHLQHALAHGPNDPRTKQALAWVEAQAGKN